MAFMMQTRSALVGQNGSVLGSRHCVTEILSYSGILPDQSVQPDVLRRVQVSVENIRKVCWRSADALQAKEWEGVNHQTQLELSLQSRVSLRERLIELGHACVKLENWGIA